MRTMTHTTCTTMGCDKKVSAKGLCRKHYMVKWREVHTPGYVSLENRRIAREAREEAKRLAREERARELAEWVSSQAEARTYNLGWVGEIDLDYEERVRGQIRCDHPVAEMQYLILDDKEIYLCLTCCQHYEFLLSQREVADIRASLQSLCATSRPSPDRISPSALRQGPARR